MMMFLHMLEKPIERKQIVQTNSKKEFLKIKVIGVTIKGSK